ncbi:MAG: nuclear transport factor 2 family protein [Thermoanaerobaculia bacterium]
MKKSLRCVVPALVLALAAGFPAFAANKGENLESTPQAAVYRVQEKAIQAGDFDGYKKTMTRASAAGIDQQMKGGGMDAKKGMELMKMMQPTNLKLTSLKVDKNKATMMATGILDGQVNKGTIEFEQEDGKWKIVKQSWTNAK